MIGGSGRLSWGTRGPLLHRRERRRGWTCRQRQVPDQDRDQDRDQRAPIWSVHRVPTIAATGGTGTVAVSAGAGCAWTASSNAAWVTVTSGASGSGEGPVTFSVAANPGGARSGTLTIAGQMFTVTQAAAAAPAPPPVSCTYSISSTSSSIAASGGTGTVAVSRAPAAPGRRAAARRG